MMVTILTWLKVGCDGGWTGIALVSACGPDGLVVIPALLKILLVCVTCYQGEGKASYTRYGRNHLPACHLEPKARLYLSGGICFPYLAVQYFVQLIAYILSVANRFHSKAALFTWKQAKLQ